MAVVSTATAVREWEWLKWLPHTSSEFSPLAGDHLASSGPAATRLVAAIEASCRRRRVANAGRPPAIGVRIVLWSSRTPVRTGRLVSIAEQGPPSAFNTLWVGLVPPAAAGRVPPPIDLDSSRPTTIRSAGFASAAPGGSSSTDNSLPVRLEPLGRDGVGARSGVEPAGRQRRPPAESSDVPSAVSFLADQGGELADDPSAVVERWRQSASISFDTPPGPRRERTLRAYVGAGAAGVMSLDLRNQGPHALVGGTTGSGKSEFLQTWLMGLATAMSPERVNFLLVDYKGGSAFGPCSELPHSVGMVTDLTPRLVRRALVSLRAELHRREHPLGMAGQGPARPRKEGR
ncbi:MAG: hypothetical protein IPG46_06555 [Actinobacteria bacterium]|nr:hypothetical protein [Actinomycetota bacterium]